MPLDLECIKQVSEYFPGLEVIVDADSQHQDVPNYYMLFMDKIYIGTVYNEPFKIFLGEQSWFKFRENNPTRLNDENYNLLIKRIKECFVTDDCYDLAIKMK